MKILLLYPPDRAFPAVPYASLPALSPCLKQAGHEVVLRDINLEVFLGLMQEETLLHHHDRRTGRLKILEAKPSLNQKEEEEYRFLAHVLSIPKHSLENVSASIRVMKDRQDFYDPDLFNQAWDDLRGAMRFYLGPNPLPSPERPDLIDRLLNKLNGPLEDPISEWYRETLVPSLLAETPDLIGVSIPFIVSYYEAMKLVKIIRDLAPGIPIVIGGSLIDSHVEPMAADPRLYRLFDYAMIGECEHALGQLASTIENGGDLATVPNLFYLRPDGTISRQSKEIVEDLNSLPSPDFTGLPLDRYIAPEPVASFQTSRGCYYGKCTFCSESFRENFRLRDPKLAVEDMVSIHATTGIKQFLLWDSLSPPKTLRHVAEEVKQRNLDFHWFAETKFEKTYLKPDFINALGEGGCRFLQFGMESANERILGLIDKDNKMDEVDIMLDNMQAANIHTSMTWFIGFPTETEAEARQSYDFIRKRRHKITLSAYTGTYNLLPDQPLFHDQDRYGIQISRNTDGGYDFFYEDGSAPYDRTEFNHAFLTRGDAELLKHGAYMLYAVRNPKGLWKLSGACRSGPLANDVEDLQSALVERPRETWITPFSRDLLKDFASPPSPAKLVYHSLTGEVFRLLGREMKVLNEASGGPVSVRSLLTKLDMEWSELQAILYRLTNRGLLRFVMPPAFFGKTDTQVERRRTATCV